MAGMQSQLDEAKSRVDSMQGQVSSLQVSGGREGGKEGGRKEGRKGGREGGKEGGRERGREGGREKGRKEGRKEGRDMLLCCVICPLSRTN